MREIIVESLIWTKDNLCVENFCNGDVIPEIKSKEQWVLAYKESRPAFCYYQNDKSNKNFGLLYNWFAVNDERGLAPIGWRIPTDNDWQNLIKNHGGYNVAGKNLKSKSHWVLSDFVGNDKNKMLVYPSGYRNFYGDFFFRGNHAYFWSSTNHYNNLAWYHTMDFMMDDVVRYYNVKGNGFPIRCVKNT